MGGSLLCGALAGVATKTILYPLDVVKKRLQVSGWSQGRAGLGETAEYSNIRQCVVSMVRQEGARSLYRLHSSPGQGSVHHQRPLHDLRVVLQTLPAQSQIR